MTDAEQSDPQTYVDDGGKLRRKPGRPRKNPQYTQAEQRALEVEARRQEREAQTNAAKVGREYASKHVQEFYKANKDNLMAFLVDLIEHSYEACSSLDLGMSRGELRKVLSRALVEEIAKSLGPDAIVDWQAAKLREFRQAQVELMQHQQAASGFNSAVPQSRPAADEIDIDALMAQGLPTGDDD